MELTPGTLLNNRYRIEAHLGQGGMGTVFMAMDTALENHVAIKANRNLSPESSVQFMREARLLANLRHPNLPRVIDYFYLEQTQYLVMDYVDGEDLDSWVTREGVQPVERVLRWAEQLGSAIGYLHSQNPPVVHRDIKPANIKITRDGIAVLVDFGIAKLSDKTQATANGAVGYTPGFAPPEQYGAARTGPYSDQYALAATLYAVLTGNKPTDSVQRVLGKSVLQAPRAANELIPEYVDAALQRAMSINPEDRFPTIDQFVQALTDPAYAPTISTSEALEQSLPPPAPIQPTRPRNRSPIWFVGVVMLLGCFLIAAEVLNLFSTPAGSTGGVQTPIAINPFTPTGSQAGGTGGDVLATPTRPSPSPTQKVTARSTLTATPSATPTPNFIGRGGWLMFSSNRGDGETFQLWKMRIGLDNGGNIVPLRLVQVTSGTGDKTQPAWSPDGKRILYVAPGTNPDWGLDIWMANQDGSQTVDLTQRIGDDLEPSWSLDGTTISFSNDGREDKVRQIYFMDPDGKNQVRVSSGYIETSPVWTPDNQWLMFVISASSHNYLYLRPYVEGEATPQPYDRATEFGRLGEVADPSFSLGGERLAYTRITGKKMDVCTVVYASRGADVDVLTTTNADSEPAWSPDDKWIAFTSLRDGNAEIYIMSDGGTLQTNLTLDPGIDQNPAWQPILDPNP